MGSVRKVKRFALIPRRIANCMVWLEHYISTEIYTDPLYDTSVPGSFPFGRGWYETGRELIP